MSDRSIEPVTETKTCNSNQWTERDTGWMFSHIGTGIGAGLLYLPLSAGAGGIWPLLIMAALSGPMVLLSHRGLTRFCLSSANPKHDFTQIVHEHFGDRVGHWLMFICFMSMFPVLLLYSVGITNVSISFLENQLNVSEPSRAFISLALITALIGGFYGSEQKLLRVISALVFPLTFILLGVGLYLITQWRIDFITQPITGQQALHTILITLPVLVFSFYHAPVCSSFARSYRSQINGMAACIRKTDQIHLRSTVTLLAITLFFVFSCVMAMTPEQLQQARIDNLPTLSILANQPGNLFFSALAPIIAFTAIVTSFFGFFLGTIEVMNGLLKQGVNAFKPGKVMSSGRVHRVSLLIVALSCWVAAIGNWGVLSMLETVVAPMMAILLFFLPVIALYRVKRLRPYRNAMADLFVLSVGLLVVLGFVIT